jgi:hypothetical protein
MLEGECRAQAQATQLVIIKMLGDILHASKWFKYLSLCDFVCRGKTLIKNKFLSSGHLKIVELTFYFSKFSQFCKLLVTKTPYALVVQILEQLNKISDLMHLHYQSGFFCRFFWIFSSKNFFI